MTFPGGTSSDTAKFMFFVPPLPSLIDAFESEASGYEPRYRTTAKS